MILPSSLWCRRQPFVAALSSTKLISRSFLPSHLLHCYPILQATFIVNPKPFLVDLTGQLVKVKLKWGMEYHGRLESADAYMNLQLTDCEEFLDGQFAGKLGEVLIRCNNVLYVVAAPAEEQTKLSQSTKQEATAAMEE